MTSLDIGCGNRKKEGCIGIDILGNEGVDVIHDLNIFPYPFEDSTFDEIYADNSIEHLNDVVKVMDEIYRIGKNGAAVVIIVPYFRSRYASIDPTHHHYFTAQSFTYFDPTHIHHTLYNYSKSLFKLDRVEFNEGLPELVPASLFTYLCNRYPNFYERFASHVLPMDQITFHLRISK